MTAEDVIRGFREDVPEDTERAAYANELFQEAIRLGMELNNQYHTPEELREIMERLTGKKIDSTFRLFPPFYTDFGKNITIGRDVFINSGCHFQDQGGQGQLRPLGTEKRRRVHRTQAPFLQPVPVGEGFWCKHPAYPSAAEEPDGFFQSVRPQPAGGVRPDLVQVQSLDLIPLQADGSTFSRC